MQVDFVSIVLILGIGQCLFLAGSILVGRQRLQLANKLLLALILAFLWYQVEFFLLRNTLDTAIPFLYSTRYGSWLVVGPLVLLYNRATLLADFAIRRKHWSQIKEGIAALSDDVTIEFSLLGKQINAPNFKNFFRNPKSPPGSIYVAYKEGGFDQALQQYEMLQADTSVNVNSNALNMVSYMLMMQEKYEDTETLLQRNREDFSNEGNVYDSLGELAARMGQLEKAKNYYTKSLEINPENTNALEVLKQMKMKRE